MKKSFFSFVCFILVLCLLLPSPIFATEDKVEENPLHNLLNIPYGRVEKRAENG